MYGGMARIIHKTLKTSTKFYLFPLYLSILKDRSIIIYRILHHHHDENIVVDSRIT